MQTAKARVKHVLDNLPDTASYDDIVYEIQFLRGIETGLADLDAGRSMPHDEVVARARRWLEVTDPPTTLKQETRAMKEREDRCRRRA